jgi:hypothetical protein
LSCSALPSLAGAHYLGVVSVVRLSAHADCFPTMLTVLQLWADKHESCLALVLARLAV